MKRPDMWLHGTMGHCVKALTIFLLWDQTVGSRNLIYGWNQIPDHTYGLSLWCYICFLTGTDWTVINPLSGKRNTGTVASAMFVYDDVMTLKLFPRRYWAFAGETFGHRWIPLIKDQKHGALKFSLIHAWNKRFKNQWMCRSSQYKDVVLPV